MPTPEQILQALSELSERWLPLAALWHVYVVALGVAVIAGWRPPIRVAASLILLPIVSVVVLALMTANPVTSIVLGGYVGAAIAIVVRMPPQSIHVAASWRVFAGGVAMLFGLVYPHFLDHAAPLQYLYGAPLGIVPCPTLAAAVGANLTIDSLGSRSWSLLLVAAGGFYGVFGALRLDVSLDWLLVATVLLLLASLPRTGRMVRQIASTLGTDGSG